MPPQENLRTADAVAAPVAALTDLVRTVQTPGAPAIGHWTIRDVAVHLADVFENYPRYLDGTAELFGHPMDITAHNESTVSSDRTSAVFELADRIDAAAKQLVEKVTRRRLDDPVKWHGGSHVSARAIAGVAITEAFVHGHDIATAERRPWSLDRDDVAIGLAAVADLLPLYVDEQNAANVEATFELRIRGGETLGLAFDNGTLTVHRNGPPGPRDCTVSVDPGTFLLIGYARTSVWKAAATGKVVAWGRRPWLSLQLPALIRQP